MPEGKEKGWRLCMEMGITGKKLKYGASKAFQEPETTEVSFPQGTKAESPWHMEECTGNAAANPTSDMWSKQ